MPFVNCFECSERLVKYPTGFVGEIRYFCKLLEKGGLELEIGPEDGCTFGSKGECGYAVSDYDVCLGSDAAVNGYLEDWEGEKLVTGL